VLYKGFPPTSLPRHWLAAREGVACRYKVLPGGKRQIFSFHIAGDIPDLQSLPAERRCAAVAEGRATKKRAAKAAPGAAPKSLDRA
jgi:hypothetical protein